MSRLIFEIEAITTKVKHISIEPNYCIIKSITAQSRSKDLAK